VSLADDLETAGREARERADLLVKAAIDEERDMSAEEMSAFLDAFGEEREAADRIEQLRSDEVRELRASVARTPDEPASLGTMLMRALETRTIVESSGAGQAFSPNEFSSTFWDKLPAQTVALQIPGLRVIETNRDSLTIPRWLTDTSVAWTSENTQISSSDATGDTVTATPRALKAIQYASNESLADSNPSLFDAIAAGMLRAVGEKFDLGFFEGSGTPPEIRGLGNVANIQVAATGSPDLDDVVLAIEMLEDYNATPTALIMHPRAWTDYLRIKEATSNNNKPVLLDSAGSAAQGFPNQIFGIPVLVSSQLDPNLVYDRGGASERRADRD
jgi:HK97 family phage major capsid protein